MSFSCKAKDSKILRSEKEQPKAKLRKEIILD